MAGNVRFHSKYHSKSHHTTSSPGYFDSAADPIANAANPFQGDFYLNGTLSAQKIVAASQFISVLSAGGVALTVKAITGNYTVLSSDFTIFAHGGASGSALIMPPASSVPSQQYIFKRTSTTTVVTLCSQGSDLFEAQYSTIDLNQLNVAVMLVSFQNKWWVLDTVGTVPA